MDLQGFGNGTDGMATISSNITETVIDSAHSVTSGSKTVTATNASFATGKLIFMHQTKGTGAGSFEWNIIDTYVAGTITAIFPAINTYSSTGSNKAQVRVVPQYSSFEVQTGKTYTAKSWDGTVGGLMIFLCSGTATVSGTISGKGVGFRAGGSRDIGSGEPAANATVGENYGGTQPAQRASVNGGGGAGTNVDNGNQSGGGAGYGTDGTDGTGGGSNQYGLKGTTYGDAALTVIHLGAGGGGYTYGGKPPMDGTRGGGALIVFSREFICSSGSIDFSGGDTTQTAGKEVFGGLGSGGTILIRTTKATLGTDKMVCNGGVFPSSFYTSGAVLPPGNGGRGRIRVEACELTGITTPSNPATVGGYSYCQSFIHIYG